MPDARYVGRVPLTLRPGDGLCLGLECLEHAIPLFLDDIVHNSGPFPPAFGAGLNEDCRHVSSPPKAPTAANDLPAGSAPRLARPLRGREQRFTVRHHAEGLLQLGGATMYDTRT